MHLYFNGKLIHVGSNSFQSKDGEQVSYFINTIGHDGGTITINSKKDFSEFLDKIGVIKLIARPDAENPKAYKLSLSDISPVETSNN